MLGMNVMGVGTVWRDATFKPINSDGGWCNYAILIKKDKGPGNMVYYCHQWFMLNSKFPSLITSGKTVVVSGIWKVDTKKQPDGTTNIYHSITVDHITFIDHVDKNKVVEKPAKQKSKIKQDEKDLSNEAPW